MMLVTLKAEFNHIDDAVNAGKMSSSEVKLLKGRINAGDAGVIFEVQVISRYAKKADVKKIELEVATGSGNKKIYMKYTKSDGTVKYVEITSIKKPLTAYKQIANAIKHGVEKIVDTNKKQRLKLICEVFQNPHIT